MTDDCIQANVYIIMLNHEPIEDQSEDRRVVKVNDNSV